VPINSALAAAITFLEALRGLMVIFILVGWILVGGFYIANYLATILGSAIPFLVDFIYRLVYIVFDLLQWAITTPVQALFLPIRWIARMMSGSMEDKPESSSSKQSRKR
jgi:hypothetical protein